VVPGARGCRGMLLLSPCQPQADHGGGNGLPVTSCGLAGLVAGVSPRAGPALLLPGSADACAVLRPCETPGRAVEPGSVPGSGIFRFGSTGSSVSESVGCSGPR